ncbi:hypothetical protein BZG02_17935 [Labilibaculum filiforme]|uniref:DUF3857 domain-containing protein n=1 Tax=Labilibaculum filiforme TaxID=1940526 RepID=A0A2N3HS65_9BACT|nr:DUF3857 domain-containing protein [Labilibaculum filiforme]PKQ60877.1 hypothetical protein BZG02_17935 [Labilibaculum filiforme]
MNNLMKITFSLFLFIAAINNSKADNGRIKFGKVSMEELAMTTYDKDTSAVAVILYDSGSSYFETQFINESSDFVIKFERHVRIKILKPEGFNYATFKIPLYHSTDGEEKMGSIKAKTYNLDGKIITDKLERNSIFDEETTPNWKQVKFTMPNIKVGSVLEIKYQVTTPFFHNFKAWKFQYSIPVVYSEYNTRIPSYFNYQITTKGYYPLTTTNDGHRTENFLIKYTEMDKNSGSAKSIEHQYTLTPVSQANIYSAENIPAFKSESYMLAEENYMCCIEFELQSYKFDYGAFHNFTSTWENVNEKLIKSDEFGLAMKKDGFTKDILSEIIKEEQTEEEKTALLFQAVQNNVKWDEKYRLFCDKSLKNTWKDKAGSSAEINLLLVAMLREAGIKANPIVLSTRKNGIIHPSHPTITQMNYVIACAEINDKKYLMDATDPYCPIGILPFRCLNDKGRLITENDSEWINLDPNTGSKISMVSSLSLTKEGTIEGKISEAFYDYESIDIRKKIANNTDGYSEKLESNYEDWNISEIEYKNLDDRNKPTQIRYSVAIENLVNMEGERIYFNPILKYKTSENPFKLEQREYPVNFGYPISVSYLLILELPENYILEEQPKSSKITLPDNGGEYTYQVNYSNNKVVVKYAFSTDKTQYVPSEYEYLKEFYNQIIAKENQILVLKKTEPTALK